MGRLIEIGGLRAYIEQSRVVFRDSGFTYTPAEAIKLTKLLGFAGSMAELKALPEEISDPPFVIKFTEDGNHQITREESEPMITFTFETIDDMIKAVSACADIALDMQRINPKPLPRGGLGSGVPDIIDGRN